jgi:hypothetical protein
MRLSDFIVLNEEEKKFTVLHRGVLISKRKARQYIVFLFQLDGFYVEMFCNTQTKVVLQYRAFAHTGLLHPYLEAIAIDGLFEA